MAHSLFSPHLSRPTITSVSPSSSQSPTNFRDVQPPVPSVSLPSAPSSDSPNPRRVAANFFSPLDSSEQYMQDPSPSSTSPVFSASNVNRGQHTISRSVLQIEKDNDDPTIPISRHGHDETTAGTTLTRLLSADYPTSPSSSRTPSYITAGLRLRSKTARATNLPNHLYTRGLLEGRHSDITVCAFNTKYYLHRLILDRAPFFANALSEPWLESSSKEITLHPEEIDSNVSQVAFEIALKRLYGADISADQDEEAVGLFATGCWLEMQDLVELSVGSILRQMAPQNLGSLIRLVTANNYGRGGQRILASAKAMLCREGWDMPLTFWDAIPGDVVLEIVGGDGFFVNDEWDRWTLARRLLDLRLKQVAIEASILNYSTSSELQAPQDSVFHALRFDRAVRQKVQNEIESLDEVHSKWILLYSHPEVDRLLTLLEEGIYYAHFEFEQLQCIRQARDIFDLPIVSEKLITDALWLSVELRQKVTNAKESDLELGLSNSTRSSAPRSTSKTSLETPAEPKSENKPDNAIVKSPAHAEQAEAFSEPHGGERRFRIPSCDANMVLGGTTDVGDIGWQLHPVDRLSAAAERSGAEWVTMSSPGVEGGAAVSRSILTDNPSKSVYSRFPPLRFSAEFPHPKSLKVRKRVYSRTVFYAGSLWNIYIQKVKTTKGIQLGVYLHRAKEEVDSGTGPTVAVTRTVDERIGVLENQISQRISGPTSTRTNDNNTRAGEDDLSSCSNERSAPQRSRAAQTRPPPRNNGQTGGTTAYGRTSEDSESDSSLDGTTFPTSVLNHNRNRIPEHAPSVQKPTIPSYTDARPTIKTYFKIYSPSKGGRLLSVYESAPDQFNFSQSWGWRSTTLMLDEGLEEETDEAGLSQGRGEGKLRFCVVIGNL